MIINYSYKNVTIQADALAAGLKKLGCKRGDRVGMWGPNSWEWVVTQYATARAGLILVCYFFIYSSFEILSYIIHVYF